MSATKMTAREDKAAVAECLRKAEHAASEAATYFDDVKTGEYAMPRDVSDQQIGHRDAAQLLGMAYAARYSAICAVEAADRTIEFLLNVYHVSLEELDEVPKAVAS